jgi:integrase
MSEPAAIVKCGSTAIRIMRLGNGRYRYRYKHGNEWKERTGNDLGRLKVDAFKSAKLVHGGHVDLVGLNSEQREACALVVKLGLTAEMINKLIAEKPESTAIQPIIEVVSEFLAIKKAKEGLSTRNHDTLKCYLTKLSNKFGERAIGSVTTSELELWVAGLGLSNRSMNGIRQILVTMFRWARSRGKLPDKTTEAEKMERCIIKRESVTLYDRDTLNILLKNVRDEYHNWLVIAAWAGIRHEEMFPSAKSSKSPLDWSDFDWERIIIVRPETSKTSKRRIIPILPCLEMALKGRTKESGRVGPLTSPATRETIRLGKLIGGWSKNALRHSFGTYRAAVVKNIGQVSLEMGNSQSMCLQHYHEAVSEGDGLAWFSVSSA